ncbi:MAG: hypothetical protein HRU13_06610, partial [Phycisphaerales bacterium]|nr:hypothetical protein [Phycisphaerales bacterium]
MNGKFTNTSIIAGIAALASGVSSAAADEMWAVSASSDSLFVFDSDTGATVRVVGPLGTNPDGYQTAVSMAVDDAGRIFIINNSPAPVSNLSRVDPETGRATHIGGDVFFSLSFGPDGQLFGLNLAGRLCTVDPTTGLTTSLGGPILPTVLGLDYNRRDGFLYGVTSERFGAIVALLRIDPATGDFTSI